MKYFGENGDQPVDLSGNERVIQQMQPLRLSRRAKIGLGAASVAGSLIGHYLGSSQMGQYLGEALTVGGAAAPGIVYLGWKALK